MILSCEEAKIQCKKVPMFFLKGDFPDAPFDFPKWLLLHASIFLS